MSKQDTKVSAGAISLNVESTSSSSTMERALGREMQAQIERERWRAETLPNELTSLLAPLLEPIVQAVQVMQLLQQRWASWIEENREWLTQVRGALQEAGEKVGVFVVGVNQASVQFAQTLNEVERLARIGWTLPTQLSLSELIEFMASTDAEEAANYLIKKLNTFDPEFLNMEERLQKNPLLREFPTVLTQCFSAIRRGDYAITVPTLVAMLERIIQQLNPAEHHADTNVLKTLRETGVIARKAREDLFCAAIWLSLLKVVEGLWKQFPLEAPGTPVLSRPGIQHGRVEPPNIESEVVRLLNTLETALALHELLNSAEAFTSIGNTGQRQAMRPFWALLHASIFLPRRKEVREQNDLAPADEVKV